MITQFATLSLIGHSGSFVDQGEFTHEDMIKYTKGYTNLIVVASGLCKIFPEIEKLLLECGIRQDYRRFITAIDYLLANKDEAKKILLYLEEEMSLDHQAYLELNSIIDSSSKLSFEVLLAKRQEFIGRVGSYNGNYKRALVSAIQSRLVEDEKDDSIKRLSIEEFRDNYLDTQQKRAQYLALALPDN